MFPGGEKERIIFRRKKSALSGDAVRKGREISEIRSNRVQQQAVDKDVYKRQVPDPFAAAVPYSPQTAYTRTVPVQKTILAPGTTFVGNMTAQGDVDMDCDFQGDIHASGTVTIRTKLAGDLSANVVELVACEVQGDVHADESVRIDGSSKVIGNITGKDLNCAGSVQGNVQVSGHVTVNGSAYIEGDLEAASITIENGAGINGQMQVLPRKVQ